MADFDIELTIEKIKRQLVKDIAHEKFNAALIDIAALAEIYYEWNQFYCDDELDTYCHKIGKRLLKNLVGKWDIADRSRKVIIYCDTFGNDTRGLSLMYLMALESIGYHVVYLTRLDKKDAQPVLNESLEDTSIIYEYIDFTASYSNQIITLNALIQRYKPDIAFIYAKPYDVAVVAVFSQYIGKFERYKINLTDHAFWLGKNTFDYCIEFRNYGASISSGKRNIEKRRLICLPYYPYVDRNIVFMGIPFEDNVRYVFSGGSLYKTIGDTNKFYKIVEHILQTDKQVHFLYAGSGDDSQLKKIIEKYPDRAVHISERKDFVELIRRSVFYLNTYPTVGGQMMQYCALVGKLPVTLRHNDASGGLLLNQERLAIEFDTCAEIYEEIDKLLNDDEYLHEREKLLKGSVISEEKFQATLKDLLNNHQTDYKLECRKVDTGEIEREYRFRMKKKVLIDAIAKKRHLSLIGLFPFYFIQRYIRLKNK